MHIRLEITQFVDVHSVILEDVFFFCKKRVLFCSKKLPKFL